MIVLELFSGSESFSNCARELNLKCFTIDNIKEFEPSFCMDIMKVTKEFINKNCGNIDIIWASIPCTTFSIASCSTHWEKIDNRFFQLTQEAKDSLDLVDKTLLLIRELKPKYWIIENPRGILRKLPQMQNLPYRETIHYCSYGDNRMKPTDIWTNFKWFPKKRCKRGSDCHISAPRSSRSGTQGLKDRIERSKIPKKLCFSLLNRILELEKECI